MHLYWADMDMSYLTEVVVLYRYGHVIYDWCDSKGQIWCCRSYNAIRVATIDK